MGATVIAAAPITSTEKLLAELAKLKAENDKLRADRQKVTYRVSEKGGVSVYGLGRFPVTLYQEQWQRLFLAVPEIKAFIDAHAGELKVKGE